MHIIHNHYDYEHRYDDRHHNEHDHNRYGWYDYGPYDLKRDYAAASDDSDSGDVDDADTGEPGDDGASVHTTDDSASDYYPDSSSFLDSFDPEAGYADGEFADHDALD